MESLGFEGLLGHRINSSLQNQAILGICGNSEELSSY